MSLRHLSTQLAMSRMALAECTSAAGSSSVRLFGSVPEYWGKPSAYTEGTAFLGTPTDHQDRLKRRPISPDVFAIDKPAFHYRMPFGAVSSITHRATGVALTAGFAAAGITSLVGDLPGAIDAIKTSYPILLFPIKFSLCFPLYYHYMAGMRHVLWDHYKLGNQMDKTSLIEKDTIEKSSLRLMQVAVGLSLITSLIL